MGKDHSTQQLDFQAQGKNKMKITKSQLKQIIKEELEVELEEGRFTDFMDVFFPSASEAEKRRKIYAMSDEEIEDMKAQAAAREKSAYEREAGILQSDEDVPGEEEERTDQLARADRERRTTDRDAQIARLKARGDELEAGRLASDKAAEERAARKARRRRELGQDPLPGDERYLALQEAVLRRILELIK